MRPTMMGRFRRLWDRIPFLPPAAVMGHLYFELRSAFGRRRRTRLRIDASETNFLNLGSGPGTFPGFINIDFFNTPGIDFGADLRYPLNIDSLTADGIFCEHTLEHLTYPAVSALLKECYRILKPGGVLRAIVPDVSLFLRHYSDRNQAWFDRWERVTFIDSRDRERAGRRLRTNLEAVSFITQEYGHVSCWDFETLKFYLEESGFSGVRETRFRQGRLAELLRDQDTEGRRFVSLYVEAEKSIGRENDR